MSDFTEDDNVVDFKAFKKIQEIKTILESDSENLFEDLLNFIKDNDFKGNYLPYDNTDIYTSAICKDDSIGIGIVIITDGNILHTKSETLNINSKNFDKKNINAIAKYKALIKTVEIAAKLSIAAKNITFFTDSKFVCDLVMFRKKTTDLQFKVLYEELESLLEQFSDSISDYIRNNTPSKTGAWGLCFSYAKNQKATLLAKKALFKTFKVVK